MSWDKHEEAKLVREVKQEVGSRDETRHKFTEKSDQWSSEDRWWVDKEVWQHQRKEYYYQFEEMTLRKQVG